MLPLEAGRPPPAPLAARAAAACRRLTSCDHWPVAWAAIVLLSATLGSQRPLTAAPLGAAESLRLAALLPLLLLAAPGPARPAGWAAVAALAWLAGATASGDLLVNEPARAPDAHAPSVRVQHEGAGVLRVTARPRPSAGGGWSAPARLLLWGADAAGPAVVGVRPVAGDGVLIRADGDPPAMGDALGGWWRLAPPRREAVAGGFAEARWLQGRGLAWVARPMDRGQPPGVVSPGAWSGLGRLQARIQDRARALLSGGLPPREASLAASVLLGGGAERSLREPFARLGLAHLFALSGLHVGIVSGLLLVVVRLAVRGPGRQLPLMGTALTAYALLVDLPGSVVRAVGLVLLTMFARACGRPVDGLRILGLLLWLNVLWSPAGFFDVGLRLSYLAAAGIVLGLRLLEPGLAACPPPLRWPLRGLAVSLSAQTATLPVLAASFGTLPLAAPAVNLLAVPLFGLAATGLAAGLVLSALWTWAGHGLLACGWLILRPLQALAVGLGEPLAATAIGLPVWGAGRTVAYAAWLGVLVLLLRPGGWRRYALALPAHAVLLAIAAAGGAGWPGDGTVRAWQFAVDQGDAALIRLPDGWTCLIDTGPPGWRGDGPLARDVLPFLHRLNLATLDAAVLTHGHADHTGGAEALADRLPVRRWYLGGQATAPDASAPVVRPVAGDTLHAARGWALVCLHPPAAGWQAGNENDRSIALGLCRQGRLHGLWTGDLEAAGERVLLGRLPPVGQQGLDYWKAGHHGSRTSGTAELLARIRPRLVVISCGVASRHRHPSHGPYGEAIHRRTDLSATVALAWDRRGRLRWTPLHAPPPSARPSS